MQSSHVVVRGSGFSQIGKWAETKVSVGRKGDDRVECVTVWGVDMPSEF